MNITAVVVQLRLYNPVICLFVCSACIDSCCKGVHVGDEAMAVWDEDGSNCITEQRLSASRKNLIIISLIMSTDCPSASHHE